MRRYQDLYVEQGLASSEAVIKHLRADAEAGKHIMIALQWNQCAAGTSKPKALLMAPSNKRGMELFAGNSDGSMTESCECSVWARQRVSGAEEQRASSEGMAEQEREREREAAGAPRESREINK